VIETPYVGARTYHFEFVGIEGIEVFDSNLLASGRDAAADAADALDLDTSGDPASRFKRQDSNRVHHYWTGTASVDQVSAIVRLRVARENFVGPAYWASLVVALSILTCGALAQPLVRHGAGAETLLLLLPGIAATLVAGTSRHPLTARVLQRAHSALLLSALCAYLTAGLLPFIHTGGGANAAGWVRGAWLGLGAIALLPLGLLYLARKLPRPSWQEGRLERYLASFQRRVLETARWAARVRQRRLQLVIRSPGLTWSRAQELAAASRSTRRFFVMPSRRRRWLREPEPYLLLRVEPPRRWRRPGTLWTRALGRAPVLRRAVAADMRYPVWGRLPRRAPLRTSARRTDSLVDQPLEMGRRLAATALWLGGRLPQGYRFEARWPRSFARSRAVLGLLGGAAVRVGTLAVGSTRGRQAPAQIVSTTPEALAAQLRGGQAMLNRTYEVRDRPVDESPSTRDLQKPLTMTAR
jgi:hypothetical protein